MLTAQEAAKIAEEAYARQETINQLELIKYVSMQGRRETILDTMHYDLQAVVIKRLEQLGYTVTYHPPTDRHSFCYSIKW